MYGLLIESVCEFIKEKFGENSWLRIRDKSRVHEYTFVTHRMYSEKIIPRLAQAVYDVTGYSREQFMDETGVQFVKFLNKYEYDKMLRVLGRSLGDFLNGLDNLHEYLRFSYPKMKPPSFFCTDESLKGLTLHYRSRRKGYTHYVKGQLRQVAKQFYNQEVSVIIVEEKQSSKDTYYVKFRINFDNKEYTERTRISSVMMNGHAQLRANLFFDVFPFHIVFGNDMKIRNSGKSSLYLFRLMNTIFYFKFFQTTAVLKYHLYRSKKVWELLSVLPISKHVYQLFPSVCVCAVRECR